MCNGLESTETGWRAHEVFAVHETGFASSDTAHVRGYVLAKQHERRGALFLSIHVHPRWHLGNDPPDIARVHHASIVRSIRAREEREELHDATDVAGALAGMSLGPEHSTLRDDGGMDL